MTKNVMDAAISKNKIEMSFEDVRIDLQGNVSQTETIEILCPMYKWQLLIE